MWDPTSRLKMIQAIDHCIAAQGRARNKCQIVKWVQRTENVEVEIDLGSKLGRNGRKFTTSEKLYVHTKQNKPKRYKKALNSYA